jgi:anaerobic ribonucleoside-triphosphate reductase activating protein
VLTVRLADLRYPVTVLGPGRRLGIWVQGCHIGCAGCMSRHTWDANAVAPLPVDAVVAEALALVDDQLDGITVSGGEPFEQGDSVAEVLDGLRAGLRERAAADVDVLCYSGLSEAAARRRSPALVARVDALICGPYRSDAPTSRPWVGSANQRVVACSDLGRQRYGVDHVPHADDARAVQIEMGPRGLTVIGIPRQGDLERVEQSLAEAGVAVRGASWHL